MGYVIPIFIKFNYRQTFYSRDLYQYSNAFIINIIIIAIPSVFVPQCAQQRSNPGMSESKSLITAFDDNLGPKKEPLQQPLTNLSTSGLHPAFLVKCENMLNPTTFLQSRMVQL